MAYTAVSFADFTARFPTLTDYPSAQVSPILAEVQTQVDDSWLSQDDYTAAVLYLTAHMLTQEANAAEKPAILASESLGAGMSKSYVKNSMDDEEGLTATEYGRRYLSLRDRNFPGILAV